MVPKLITQPRIAMTGVGLVCPLGEDAAGAFEGLRNGQSIRALGRVDRLATGPGTPRISTLATRAARQAVAQAGWNDRVLAHEQTALVMGTSKGPIDEWITALPHMADETYVLGGRLEVGLARVADDVAAALEAGFGPRLTVSGACASGLHALVRAVLMIRAGECRRALVVAAESSLHDLFIGSFRRLGVLAADGEPCRPFDERRSGFVISEAAAAVCIEAEPARSPLACVDRFALGTDAEHLTAGHPDGRTLQALMDRVLNGRPVDLVHAHGTGTARNDPIELAAVERAIYQADPGTRAAPVSIYSHKGGLGHSLGASGLVSVVLNCLMHQTSVVLPNAQTRRPLACERTRISPDVTERPVRRSIVAAAGFGGAAGVVGLVSP